MSIQFTVAHWNINETRTTELVDADNPRMKRIAETILSMNRGVTPDFVSFNELEFDLCTVPSAEYETTGKNLTRLLQRFKDNDCVTTTQPFCPGNCGIHGRAQRMKNGEYYNVRNGDETEKLKYGDLLNCLATLPGQYGVGFWSRYEIVEVKHISRIKWEQFNPSVSLCDYALPPRTPQAEPTALPRNITLFDKCLMIVKVRIAKRIINFVAMHAVPAYKFGFDKSSNIARNGDQIAFLEWLLIGKTYFKPNQVLDDDFNVLIPFRPDEAVIALGDFNVDWRNPEALGAKRMRALIECGNYNVFPHGATTEIGSDNNRNPVDLQLDYLFSSKNIKLVERSQKIGPIDPENLSDHGALLAKFEV